MDGETKEEQESQTNNNENTSVNSNEEAFLNRMEDVSYKIHELARRIQVPGVYPHYGVYWLKESESVEDGFSKARIAENFVSSDHAKHYVFYSEIDHNEMYENEKLEKNLMINKYLIISQ